MKAMQPDAMASEAVWFKSSYSAGDGGDCVEVAEVRDAVLVRDSKRPETPVVAVSGDGWNAFVEMVTGR